MKTSSRGLFLPRDKGLFQAGDVRANENLILSSYHTLFVREHNRLCDEIIKNNKNKRLSDETIFQAARHYIIGLLEKITYDDFLPKLMGSQSFNRYIGDYNTYDPSINVAIPLEFSTAAFRIGHPLLVSDIPLLNKNGG